jgi:hypothetical protein
MQVAEVDFESSSGAVKAASITVAPDATTLLPCLTTSPVAVGLSCAERIAYAGLRLRSAGPA